ncbi:MAG: hypothetical protein LBU42_05560 [Prevotellaceae bacterium]|nr:hypothetical protein [Prevotellaceae bacterium]
MKKFFFLAMLVSIAASAQRTTPITIKNTKVDYVTKIITFDLSWKGNDATHRDEVWVFVDIQPVTGANTLGSWSPATLVPNATTVTADSGNQYASLTHTAVSGNMRGLWVKGTASNTTQTFAATIKVTLASDTPAKFNACAYATDYPPNIASVSNSTYTLNGTTSFKINGTAISGNQYSGTVNTLTDPTECPGCVAIRDFNRSSANVSIPCCPNLTAIGDYCRDLVADDASTFTGCGIEIKSANQGALTSYGGENYLCPTGWRYPNDTEGLCMGQNYQMISLCACGNYKHELIVAGSNYTYPRAVSFDPSGAGLQTAAPWADFRSQGGYVQVRCVRN